MLFKWFTDNEMKANINIVVVNKKDDMIIRIGDTESKNSQYEKLLGTVVDTKLNFNTPCLCALVESTSEIFPSKTLPVKPLCVEKV